MKRYDVVDFATPVTMFDAIRVGNGARLIVTASGDFEQLAYQTDNQYVVEVRPRARATAAVAEKDKVYTGERLTLNFQDIDVRPLLQLLADTSGQNIVVSDSVKGRVTLRLQNVPWDQALDIVLKTKGLDMRRKDNVILVAPQAELAAQEKAELEAQKDIQELAPLRTEFLTVNYAKATEIARLVKSAGGGSLLSERGNVTVDERTNTLLVQDTAENLTAVRSMVATLDIPVRQVLIESRIVIVADDFSRDLGVRAGFTRVSDDIKDLMAVSGSAQATDSIMGSALDNLANTGQPFPVEVPFGPAFERYNVNMPVANPAGRIALSILDFDDFLIDLELSAAQNEGRGEIKSTPRVITANQREAIIEQGVEIPYQESASSGATTTQFKKAVLSLKVTPQITPDDRVILDLVVTKDSVGQLVPSATGGFVPSIDTRNIQTQVLVKDGQTVVLGGIMETERRDSVKKVPGLGDVPVVGNLFKSKSKINNRDELLIFVTPKILREGSHRRSDRGGPGLNPTAASGRPFLLVSGAQAQGQSPLAKAAVALMFAVPKVTVPRAQRFPDRPDGLRQDRGRPRARPPARPAVRRQRRRGRVAHGRRHRLHFRARRRGGLPHPRARRDRRADPDRRASCSRPAAARCCCAENRERLAARGTVVFLDTTIEQQLERTRTQPAPAAARRRRPAREARGARARARPALPLDRRHHDPAPTAARRPRSPATSRAR